MSKYTSDDSDIKALPSDARSDYEVYLLKYDVEADKETSEGTNSAKRVRAIIRRESKVEGDTIGISNVAYFYKVMYFFLWSIVMTFIFILIVYFIFSLILSGKNEVWKFRRTVSGYMLLFALLLFALIFILSKMKQRVQDNIEKIIYKL